MAHSSWDTLYIYTYKYYEQEGVSQDAVEKNGDENSSSDEMSENGEYFETSGAEELSYNASLIVANLYINLWHDCSQWATTSSLIEASRSHTPHSVGFVRTSGQFDALDLYLTTHDTHNRQTSMAPVGFDPPSQQAGGCRPTS
jgi:hypothetical protein